MKRYFKVGVISQMVKEKPTPLEELKEGVIIGLRKWERYDNYKNLEERYNKILKKTLDYFYSWQKDNREWTGRPYDWKILSTKLVFEKFKKKVNDTIIYMENVPSIMVEVESLNINEEYEKKFNYIYRCLIKMFKENIWRSGHEEEFIITDYNDEYGRSPYILPLCSKKITEKQFMKV